MGAKAFVKTSFFADNGSSMVVNLTNTPDVEE